MPFEQTLERGKRRPVAVTTFYRQHLDLFFADELGKDREQPALAAAGRPEHLDEFASIFGRVIPKAAQETDLTPRAARDGHAARKRERIATRWWVRRGPFGSRGRERVELGHDRGELDSPFRRELFSQHVQRPS